MIGSMNIKLLEVSKTIKYSSRSAMQMGENFELIGEGVEVKWCNRHFFTICLSYNTNGKKTEICSLPKQGIGRDSAA